MTIEPLGLLIVAAIAILVALAVLSARRPKRAAVELEASMGWPAWTGSTPPRVLARVYAGRGEQTVLHAAQEARVLASYGYVAVSQSVTGASWQTSEWAACIILTFFFGLGLLLFLVYAFVDPATAMLVVYERRTDLAAR